MIHPIGVVFEPVIRFSGTVTSPTGTLFVNGSSTGTSVTATASGKVVTCSVSTSGLSVNDRIYISVSGTVGGSPETQRSATRVMRHLPAPDSSGNVMPQNLTGYSAVYYVSPTGNNSNSGLTPALAKLTITSAKAAASAGSLIRVMPGTYTSDTNILKDGVDMYFAPGAIVDFQDASPASENMLSDEDGAVRCRVMGYGQFVRSVVDNSINLVHITNADSRVWIEAAELGRDENDIHDHAIYITAGTVDLTIPRIDTLAMASGRAIDIGGGTVRFHGDVLAGDGIDITGAADVTTFGRIQSSNIGVYPRGAGVTYRAYGDITAASEPLKIGTSATGVAIFDGVTLRRTGGTDPAIRAENGVSSSMLVVMRRSLVLAPGTYSAIGDAGASLTLTVDQHTTLQKPLGDNVSLAYTTTATALSTLTQQNVADAMKLAPSAGAAAAGSVQDKLDDAGGGGGTDYSDQLDAIQAQTDKITTSQVNVVNPFKNGTLTLTAGCSYTTAGGNAISIPKPDGVAWPADLSGYTVTLHAKVSEDTPVTDSTLDGKFTTTIAVTDPTGAQTLSINALAATTTADAATGKAYRWEYSIRAVSGSTVVELISGALVLRPLIIGAV